MPTSTTVTSQAELDTALAAKAETIYIDSPDGVRLILENQGSSHVVARGSSHVDARDSSHVVARGSSHVVAWDSSHVVARDSSHVVAWDSSHVVARDSSHVDARDSSHVVAWDSSHVDARDSSHVDARGSSHVDAWDSSHVDARDSSHVDARDSSHVDAWDSSHVDARDSSHVDARKYVGVHLHSQRVTLNAEGHVIDLTGIDFTDPAQWCDFHGVETDDGVAYVYKAVDDDWKSDYGTEYQPGSTPEAPDWMPTRACGNGLHFCAHPLESLEYKRDATRFVKCGVRLDEMVTLDDKIKARRVVAACVEVDRYGAIVEAAKA